MYRVIKITKLLAISSILLWLSGCNSSSTPIISHAKPGNANLVPDIIAPVPLVNGVTNFSFYVSNVGNADLTNLQFSVNGSANSSQYRATNLNNVSIDASGCTTIKAGSSCKLDLTAESVTAITVVGTSNNTPVITSTVSLYPLTVNSTLESNNALVLLNYPSTLVLQPNNGRTANSYSGSVSLSVVNQYDGVIDVTNLLSNLPANVTWQPINCPNPLTFGGVCQIRVLYSGGAIDHNIVVNLQPRGTINGNQLPVQQSTGTLSITQSNIAVLNPSYPSMALNGYNPTNNTTIGYVTNSGTESANISSITIANSVFSIVNNQCTGVLAPGATCRYTVSADMGQLSHWASGNYSSQITVSYNNGVVDLQSSAQLSYSYTPITPANPSISISGVTNLSESVESGLITVSNLGDVALTNMHVPELSGYTLGVTITDPNDCVATTIYPGSSCSFALNYSPTESKINQVVTVGGISATYLDPVTGSESQIQFNNQYAVNITTSEAAMLTLTPSSLTPNLDWTNSTAYSESVVVTNIGGAEITDLEASVENPEVGGTLHVSGCPEELGVNESCVLTVTGNYPVESMTYNSNGIIMLDYVDTTSSHNAQSINVDALVQMRPVVTPGLSISGTLPSTMYAGINNSQTVVVTLSNNTTATNNGNTSIEIATNSFSNIGADLIGEINTNGLNNPCDISESNIILGGNQSCSVNLVIAATNTGNIQATVTPTYQYYTYNSISTTPSLEAASEGQLSTLSGLIHVSPRTASLDLTFYSESNTTTPISTLSVAQSGESTLISTAVLKITNSGTTALTGITMPSINGFTFTPDSSCSTLAAGESCNVGISLSSSSVISATNINLNPANIISFTYSNHSGTHSSSSNLPSLTYQVVAPTQPQINTSTSFSGCYGGVTNVAQICNLNSGGSGVGTVGSYKFIVTYTNVSTSAIANNFTVTSPPSAIATGYNTTPTNNCNNVTLSANNGTCTVEYSLTSVATSGNIGSGLSLGSYSYKYGSGNLAASESVTNPNSVTLNIIQPSLAISLSGLTIESGESTVFSGTISNWYASNIPSSISITSSNSGVVASTTASCSSNATGAVCTRTLVGSTGSTNLSSNITAPNGATVAANPSSLTLQVNAPTYFKPYYPAGCVANNTAAGITGTCECIRDSRTNKIWLAVGPNSMSTQSTGSWTNWTTGGSSINTYNSTAHCGLTGGWHLPTNVTINYYSFMSSVYPGGNWGEIAVDAGMNGTAYAIGAWMNNNGFSKVGTIGSSWYWGSIAYDTTSAFVVRLSDGNMNAFNQSIGYFVMLVNN